MWVWVGDRQFQIEGFIWKRGRGSWKFCLKLDCLVECRHPVTFQQENSSLAAFHCPYIQTFPYRVTLVILKSITLIVQSSALSPTILLLASGGEMLEVVKLRLFWAWHKHHWGNCCLVLEPITSSNQLKISSCRWSCDWEQCWTMVWRCLWLFANLRLPCVDPLCFMRGSCGPFPERGNQRKACSSDHQLEYYKTHHKC